MRIHFGIAAFVVLCLASCSRQETQTSIPAAEAEPSALLTQLVSENPKASASAHVELVRKGESILPALIQEMNNDQHISGEQNQKKLSDPKWKNRMRIAGVIQEISKQDFAVYTSAHGWSPDHSFNLINKWWNKREGTPNKTIERDSR